MKKVYSIFERLVCIFLILLLSLIAVTLFLKYNSEIILVVIGYICVVLTIVALLKLFTFPSHIDIRDNMVKVFDFPLLATNKFYVEDTRYKKFLKDLQSLIDNKEEFYRLATIVFNEVKEGKYE